MKLRFIVFLIAIIVLLSAQFSNPLNINGLGDITQSSGQRAYQIVDEDVYIAYIKDYIYFTKITDGNIQSHELVDVLLVNTNQFTNPAIQVLENGDIVIVYSEAGNTSNNFLKVATSIDDGQTFDIDVYLLDCFMDSHIVQRNDELDICYTNALPGKNLSDYMYFTDSEKSENEDGGFSSALITFTGNDELDGPVHSNDDIWIFNSGGWPTFHDMVTTAGRIMDYATATPAIYTAPMEDIFPGGYAEEVSPIDFNPTADLIRQNGILLGNDDTDIVYVKLADGAFESMFGEIVQTGIDTFKVYSWFPHNAEEANIVVNNGGNWFEESDHIYTNTITHYDTIWSVGPSFSVTYNSIWVGDAELWIEGEVYGAQTWASADTIFIVGDITYANTVPGESPDDPENPNITDYFGLLSEKKILIKYKHKDPFNNMELRDDNCEDIMLYGIYAAIGEGDENTHGEMACHYDGIFTFEYQHPHGSTPNFTALSPYTLQETLYTYVDLHKYIFPQDSLVLPEITVFNLHGGTPVINGTCGFPYESPAYIDSYPNNIPNEYVYPYGTDYPWYNPVWPESSDDIVFERGNITLYGSIAQRRRGFIRRSGSDPYNHPEGNSSPSPWEMDEYHFDGFHPNTGYDKDYHYDSRLCYIQPPDFPMATSLPDTTRDIYVLHSSNYGQSFSESYIEDVGEIISTLWMDSDGESVLIAYQTVVDYGSFHFLISNDDPQDYEHYVVESDGTKLINAHIYGNEVYVLTKSRYDNDNIIYRYQVGNPIPELIQSFEQVYYLSDFTVSESGTLVYVYDPEYHPEIIYLDFRYDDGTGSMMGLETWDYLFGPYSAVDSHISIKLDENNKAYTTLLKDIDDNGISMGELYLISGELDGIVEILEDEIISPKISMQIYPNPFNPETTISFSLTTESTEDTEINIYNVKGQKVKQLVSDQLSAGQHKVDWNGKDMNGKSVSTGVYLFELKSDGKVQKTKKGLLLK
ncbi:MAG: FlgD immunoglobulin-like domain containing protein [Candidatus Cloacimonadota bacterium]|nr:FlgD immunoglobulin-like domain containing protein [Candidatus Cloacimonadota bacterium]